MIIDIFAHQTDDWQTLIKTDDAFKANFARALENLRQERDHHNQDTPSHMHLPMDDKTILAALKHDIILDMAQNGRTLTQSAQIVFHYHATRPIGCLSPDDAKRHVAAVQKRYDVNKNLNAAQISRVFYHARPVVNKLV